MKKWIFAWVTLFLLIGCKQNEPAPSNISLYETQLFKDIQLAAVFKDSKTFVDLVPKEEASVLEAKYSN